MMTTTTTNNKMIHQVDYEDYMQSVVDCKSFYTQLEYSIQNDVTKYVNNINLEYNGTYFFKITRKDNKNGFLVCKTPYENSDFYYVFLVLNNIKNKKPIAKVRRVHEMMRLIKYNLFNVEYQRDCCKDLYDHLFDKLATNEYGNIMLIHNPYNIKVLDFQTNNGYKIVFTFNKYAKIMPIKYDFNQRKHVEYADTKHNYFAVDKDDVFTFLVNNIQSNKHNNNFPMMVNVIDSEFIDSDVDVTLNEYIKRSVNNYTNNNGMPTLLNMVPNVTSSNNSVCSLMEDPI